MNVCTLDEARAAKPRALTEFRRKASVVGVGITRIGEGYGVKSTSRNPRQRTSISRTRSTACRFASEVVGKIQSAS